VLGRELEGQRSVRRLDDWIRGKPLVRARPEHRSVAIAQAGMAPGAERKESSGRRAAQMTLRESSNDAERRARRSDLPD
jgi:hypothetical protein